MNKVELTKMEKEKPIYDGKDIKWYDIDEANMWESFEKQKTNELFDNPHAFDLFSSPNTDETLTHAKKFFEYKKK